MRWAPSSRTVPAGSSAFATATSSSARRRTVFSVSAYVAMECLRGNYTGSPATRGRSAAAREETPGRLRQRARQRGPGGHELERRLRAFGHIRDRTAGGAPIDAAFLVGVREQETMIGEDVDDPRDPPRESREAGDRPLLEETDVRRAGDLQSMVNVLGDFSSIERPDLAVDGDRLAEMSEVGILQPRFELGRAGEQELKSCVGSCAVEVDEQPELREGRRIELLAEGQQQRGLARARFAGEHHQASLLPELVERLPV